MHKDSRGMRTGPDISLLLINWEKFTRREVSRLVNQGWCISGRLMQPMIHRIMLSKVCAVTDSQYLDRPIADYCEETAEFFNSLRGYKKVKPSQ